MSDTTTIVELTPATSTLLYHAWYCEQSRIRHKEECWFEQARKDEANVQQYRQTAIDSGVPADQADRFIFSGPMSHG